MSIVIAKDGGTPNVDEIRILHDGANGHVRSMNGGLYLEGANVVNPTGSGGFVEIRGGSAGASGMGGSGDIFVNTLDGSTGPNSWSGALYINTGNATTRESGNLTIHTGNCSASGRNSGHLYLSTGDASHGADAGGVYISGGKCSPGSKPGEVEILYGHDNAGVEASFKVGCMAKGTVVEVTGDPNDATLASVDLNASVRLRPVTSDPSAPASGGTMFTKVVGGKTKLYVLFPTGSAQQLAVEP